MDRLPRRIIYDEFSQVIINHSISGLSNAVIGVLLSLPRTTVATITKNFHNTGKRTGMKRGGDRRWFYWILSKNAKVYFASFM